MNNKTKFNKNKRTRKNKTHKNKLRKIHKKKYFISNGGKLYINNIIRQGMSKIGIIKPDVIQKPIPKPIISQLVNSDCVLPENFVFPPNIIPPNEMQSLSKCKLLAINDHYQYNKKCINEKKINKSNQCILSSGTKYICNRYYNGLNNNSKYHQSCMDTIAKYINNYNLK